MLQTGWEEFLNRWVKNNRSLRGQCINSHNFHSSNKRFKKKNRDKMDKITSCIGSECQFDSFLISCPASLKGSWPSAVRPHVLLTIPGTKRTCCTAPHNTLSRTCQRSQDQRENQSLCIVNYGTWLQGWGQRFCADGFCCICPHFYLSSLFYHFPPKMPTHLSTTAIILDNLLCCQSSPFSGIPQQHLSKSSLLLFFPTS